MKTGLPGLILAFLFVACGCSQPSQDRPSPPHPRSEAQPLAAGPAFKVKTISPYASNLGGGASSLVTLGGTIYFRAGDSFAGDELWRSDGTEAGTVRVRDINPGRGWSSPESLMTWNGTLFFVADDGTYGKQLWKSDGTEAGTVQVKYICPGLSTGAGISWLTPFNGALYFVATECSTGSKLWKTDGTQAGTVLVGDPSGITIESPQKLVAVGSALFFYAAGPGGWALWKTDGTAAGTAEVIRLNSIDSPVAMGGALYFTYDDGQHGTRLWRSDGTAAGTGIVTCASCSTFQVGVELWPVGNTLYFNAWDGVHGYELWKSDGTANGTVLVKDLVPGSGGSYSSNFVQLGNRLYFLNNESDSGAELLWSTDGTTAGTTMVDRVSSYSSELTVVGSSLFFRSNGELWRSDGNPGGTAQLKDIYPGFSSSEPQQFVALGSTVLFAANDGAHGWELWKSDGTAAGTVLVKDIDPPLARSSAVQMVDVNGTLFFAADDGTHGNELWKSDGTEAGTVLVKDIIPGSTPSSLNFLTRVNSTLYFSTQRGLWRSDGTEAGTVRVKDPATGAQDPVWLTALGNLVIFRASDDTAGTELWRSDGTEEGTYRLADIRPGLRGSDPSSLVVLGGKVYFAALAPNEPYRHQVWMTDGTVAGTQLLKDISPPAPNVIARGEPGGLTVFNGALYCNCSDATFGSELWKSDGTPAGTRLLKDILPGPDGSYPEGFTQSGSTLLFSISLDPYGRERHLWKTDGTPAGTQRVGPANPTKGLYPALITPVRGEVAFMAYESGIGYELWSTHGSASGLSRLKDFIPGPTSGLLSASLLALEEDGYVLFSPATEASGAELWLSDGTVAGTHLLQDILPGPDSSNPSDFTRSGAFVYFNAMDRESGHQLWALRIADLPDTNPPQLVCPARIVIEATSLDGATVSFTASASDNRTANPQVTYSHASGTMFPLGSTLVVITGTDEASNSATCTFEVLVQDTTPPELEACPADIEATASSAAGAQVSFTLPGATDALSPPVSVTASPASGSVFPVGNTSVVVTAQDTAGNRRQCQFSVVVARAPGTDGGTDPLPDAGPGPLPDAGVDAGTLPEDEPTPRAEGCGCTSPGGASLLGVVAGLVLLIQRRRGSRG
ncbi:ELWxxDGT repeat protein [Hyalangium versicolor]|uniref:ELWxxDGT repeat protein n=1 Tax=Hyalangium versicolor TaxID=2861190 RepID=UPI001CCAE84F|nr:ELWxxDGT repeat protein [Hyalangium versicolor]